MKIGLVILILVSSSGLLGNESKIPNFYEVRVDAVSPEVDAKDFPAEYKRTNVPPAQKRTSLPDVRERNESFAKSKIEAEIKKMDELDKDLLWMRAKKETLEKLTGRYPNIPREKLQSLQALVKE